MSQQPIQPIDGTDEGRAIAAATRAAAKRKHGEVVKEPSLAPIKKKGKQQPKATSTHQVAIPEGFDPDGQTFDPAVHGEQQQQQQQHGLQQEGASLLSTQQIATKWCPSNRARQQSRRRYAWASYQGLAVVEFASQELQLQQLQSSSQVLQVLYEAHWEHLAASCLLAGTLQEPCYNGPPAKSYPFELDPFQKTSVACLVRMISVLSL
jgi:superfamily II RNA helicase